MTGCLLKSLLIVILLPVAIPVALMFVVIKIIAGDIMALNKPHF